MSASYLPQKIAAALFAMLILGTGLTMIAVGGAAAQETTPLANETIEVDDNTRSIEALAENSTAVLDVTVYSIDNGTETQVDTGTLDATANTTATYTYSEIDATNYSSYRVQVEGGDADSIEINRVQVQPGGGGGVGGTGITMEHAALGGLGVILVLGLAAWRAN